MATYTYTPKTVVPGTASVDQIGAANTDSQDVNTGETVAINLPGPPNAGQKGGESSILIVLEEQDGATATVVFDAGDYPPSARKGLGSLSISLAANDLKLLRLDPGRYLQNDGTITLTVTGGVRITVYADPSTV